VKKLAIVRKHRQVKKAQAIICAALAIAVVLLPPAVQAQTVTTIYNFVGSDNSVDPLGVIAQGRDGDYYGVTAGAGRGTIYKISTSGTFTLLHTFASDGSEGQSCNGLVLGSDGNFYGTCEQGGNNSNSTGTLFKVTPTGTLTVLHFFDGTFSGTVDGCYPLGVPVQASDGNFYGTAFECGVNDAGLIYKITPAGIFTVVHAFAFGSGDGNQPKGALIQGSDGNLWGTTSSGGANNGGAVFKSSLTGTESLVFSFSACGTGTTGCAPAAGLVQGNDGNFYGTAEQGGASNEGVIFKVTPGGTYTLLHSFNITTDNGADPQLPLTLGTDSNFYGVATDCFAGGCNPADLFRITSKGVFTDVFNFPDLGGNNNSNPFSPLLLSTDGTFYSTTEIGGTSGAGSFFSLVDGQNAFIALQETIGKVGSQIGILGQGFSSSSVVKFNGTAATKVTLTGTTFLTATVPAGATNGFVTVTTGTTTLTSRQKFTVHNSWAKAAAIPVAVAAPATGFTGGKIFVVGGFTTQGAAPVSNNQIYIPTTNTWTTGAAIPTPVFAAASAVVTGQLYVIGGYEGTSQTPSNLVQIYNPATNKWTTGAAMPTARGSVAVVVDANAIYVIGGNGSTNRLTTVEKYVPSTNTWTEEAPLLNGKSEPSAGLLGTTIVAADGFTTSADTGDNEAYNVATNTWSSLAVDPNPRNASCYGVLAGQLYIAGGLNNSNPQAVSAVNESFNATANKWTTQLAMPTAASWQGSAVVNGQLYCIGGQGSFQGAAISNVQVYQP
jgi:uncharacterized repeat protein (TIGR03803 family)